MTLLKFQQCRGWRILRWKFWQVEVWYCPKSEHLPPHRHPNMDSRIVWIAGHMMFIREGKVIELRARDCGRAFYVEHEAWHSARVMGRFGLFCVIEHWLVPPSSAAFDIEYAK